jgi:hypothetical protein
MMTPPNAWMSLQLLQSIFYFHTICHLKQAKLLFNSVQPFSCLKWFFGFSENRRLSIQEIPEVTILIGFRPLTDTAIVIIDHLTHILSQGMLGSNKCLH